MVAGDGARDGTVYGLVADGDGGGSTPSKVLLDPSADGGRPLLDPHGLDLATARRRRAERRSRSAAPWPRRAAGAAAAAGRRAGPVVYEAHVRGLPGRRRSPAPARIAGLVDQLPRLAALGVDVIELMPVHQFDPQEGNYWGYMPLVFGAVAPAATPPAHDAADELAELVAAAHDRDMEVWLDVVFNHTERGRRDGPTYTLRGLDDARRLPAATTTARTSTTAGAATTSTPVAGDVRGLVLEALDRFADLGVDGFRFDLAVGARPRRRRVRRAARPMGGARVACG